MLHSPPTQSDYLHVTWKLSYETSNTYYRRVFWYQWHKFWGHNGISTCTHECSHDVKINDRACARWIHYGRKFWKKRPSAISRNRWKDNIKTEFEKHDVLWWPRSPGAQLRVTKWDSWWTKWLRSRYFSEFFGSAALIVIPPLLHANFPLPHEVSGSPDTLDLFGPSLTRHLTGIGRDVVVN